MLDVDSCKVVRTDNNQYLIRWHATPDIYPISIYTSSCSDAFNHGDPKGEPVVVAGQEQVFIPNPAPSLRHYFYLKPKLGDGVIVAERQLALDGTPNFREIGPMVSVI